jgi:organic radical activating enzyme
MKLEINELMVEVTRRCNMRCNHCLRGNARKENLNVELFNEFLDAVASIGCIIFGGGEPSLAPNIMMDILKLVKEKSIPVYRFYIVTNGKKVSKSFLNAIMRWYEYVEDDYHDDMSSMLALSQDKFHEQIPEKNKKKLRMFSFFSEDEHRTDFDKIPVQNLGRAKNLTNQKRRDPRCSLDIHAERYDDKVNISDVISFTVDGYIVPDCDYEYEEVEEIAIANMKERSWFDTLTTALLFE